jgi:hypothetical protein
MTMFSRLMLIATVLVLVCMLAYPRLLPAAPGGLMMAIAVKDASTAAKKFAARGAAAGPDYAAGVRGSGQRWQANAKAGKDNYAAGVQAAISRDAFSKGIDDAGGAHYEDRASGVGAQRFPQGIQSAQGAWEQNTAPYLQTLASLTLSPRAPKGDPRNMQRANDVAAALRRKKIGG